MNQVRQAQPRSSVVTMGPFTRDARREASRDGAPPVELIDGDELCVQLKKYDLGVRIQIRQIEEVELNPDFFNQFEIA